MKSSLILGLLGSASLLLSNTATAQQDAPRAKEQRIVVKKNTQKQAGEQSEKRAALLAEASKLNKKAAQLTEAGDLDGAVKASRKAANLLQQAARMSQQSERKQQREVRVRARAAQEARDASESELARARDQAEAVRIRVEADHAAHLNAAEAHQHAAHLHDALRNEVAGKLNIAIDGSEFEVPELTQGRYIVNINGEVIEYTPQEAEENLRRHLGSSAEAIDLLGQHQELQDLNGLAKVIIMKDGELIEGLSGLDGMAIDLSSLGTDLADMNFQFDDVEMDWTALSGEINGQLAEAYGDIELPEGVWQLGDNHVFQPGLATTGEWVMDGDEHVRFFLRDGEGGQFSFDPAEHGDLAGIWSAAAPGQGSDCGEGCEEECCGSCDGTTEEFLLSVAPELSGDGKHVILRTHVTGQDNVERWMDLYTEGHEHQHENNFEHECEHEDIHVFEGHDGMHRIIIQGGNGTQNITIHGAVHGGAQAPQSGVQQRRIMFLGENSQGDADAPAPLQRLRLSTPLQLDRPAADRPAVDAPEGLFRARVQAPAAADASGSFFAKPIPLSAPVLPGEMQDAKQLIEEMRAEMESLRQELSDLRKQMKDDPLVQAQRRPSLLPSEKPTDAEARARFREGAARLASGR